MKDYLESEGYIVKSPRETIKMAFQTELIKDGHTWMEALSNRNLTTHTYDEALTKKLVKDIRDDFFPALRSLYEKLEKERSL